MFSYYRTTTLGTEIIGNIAYRYTQDDVGNITDIEQGVRTGDATAGSFVAKLKYIYDDLGQLTRENNVYKNKTIVYNYDSGGNITSKVEYAYTTGTLGPPTATINYGYTNSNWKDLLTSYNGVAITYDTNNIGNPLSYRGYALTWLGKELSTLSGNGVSVSYKYDAAGLRSQKTVGSVTTKYEYVGDKLLYENRGGMDIYYKYNSMGNLSGITYYIGSTAYTYYVVCNAQGDVEAIYNGAGSLVAQYRYDTWGGKEVYDAQGRNISVTNASGDPITDQNNVGLINPIRYRGYYYDTEIGMYYLQSRYYDPTTCRFINADDINVLDNGMGSPIGKNLFAYCQNNPVGHSDSSGCWVLDAIFLAVDIAQFAMDPSWVGAGFILLDCLCFADPTGAADTGIHAAEIGVKAAEAAKDAEEVGHIAELSKSALKALRSKAVDKAWLEERELVKAGKGTREWTAAEKEELLNTGKVKGYEGHHINSVHNNQHLAGNPDNVKFMTRSEHFKEHGFNWRTSTDGALLNRQFMFK